MAYNKLSPRRSSEILGPRRKKPPIRQQNAELKRAIASEHETLQLLIRDAEHRKAVWLGNGRPWEPLVVWTDFDQTYLGTELDPHHLSKWKHLTEYMKLQLGFLVAIEFGGYSFTCNIPEELTQKWIESDISIPKNIQKKCRRALEKYDLTGLPYAYVLEGRSRSTRSRTNLHIHGYIIAENPMIATKFKQAMEGALLYDRDKKIGKSKAFDIQRAYDIDKGDGRGFGRWVGYFTKNVSRWDARIRGRRLFMSRPLTQTAKEFWELLRTDPFA
jgi:hypothetical protein